MNTTRMDTFESYDTYLDASVGPQDGRSRDARRALNVSDVERWASAAAGVGLLAYAVRHRNGAALAAGALGTWLVLRGATGRCAVYRAAGTGSRHDTKEALGGPRGVLVHEEMHINRPVETVYRFWRDLSNLPRAMRHLESVTPLGNGRSHWIAKGPAGLRVEWDAEIINEEESRVIGWRSLEHADVVSAGSVNFRPAPGSGTHLTVRLQYEPPAGRVGALVARLFGEDPSRTIAEDLRRVKQFLESGESTAAGAPSDSAGAAWTPSQPPASSSSASPGAEANLP